MNTNAAVILQEEVDMFNVETSKEEIKMRDGRVFLKVKIKSLAEEAKLIRKEEAKNKFFRSKLAEHRVTVVRSEARHALIAYAFIRGHEYADIEHKCYQKPNWEKVGKLVEKYGIQFTSEIAYITYKNEKEKEAILFKEWSGQHNKPV